MVQLGDSSKRLSTRQVAVRVLNYHAAVQLESTTVQRTHLIITRKCCAPLYFPVSSTPACLNKLICGPGFNFADLFCTRCRSDSLSFSLHFGFGRMSRKCSSQDTSNPVLSYWETGGLVNNVLNVVENHERFVMRKT